MAGVPELAGLADFWKCPGLLEGWRVQNVRSHEAQIRQWLTRSQPVNAGLRSGSRCNPHGVNATSSSKRWEAGHGSNQRLANAYHIGLRKEAPEPLPVLFVRQRIDV